MCMHSQIGLQFHFGSDRPQWLCSIIWIPILATILRSLPSTWWWFVWILNLGLEFQICSQAPNLLYQHLTRILETYYPLFLPAKIPASLGIFLEFPSKAGRLSSIAASLSISEDYPLTSQSPIWIPRDWLLKSVIRIGPSLWDPRVGLGSQSDSLIRNCRIRIPESQDLPGTNNLFKIGLWSPKPRF
jgi:hypothetical protein